MAGTTIQEVLGTETLTRLVKTTDDMPSFKMDPKLLKVTVKEHGNSTKIRSRDGQRGLARITRYGSPSINRQPKAVTSNVVTMLNSDEHMLHEGDTLLDLLAYDNPGRQDRGMQEIARQAADFMTLFENLRRASVYCAISFGKLWYDENGGLLVTSTGAVTTVDYSIPTDHQSSVGGLIDADWDVAGTDIRSQLQNIKADSIQETGLPLMNAYYGKNIPKRFVTNTEIKAEIAASPKLTESFWTKEIPDGFQGLNWYPMQDTFFNNLAGTVKEAFDGDKVVLTPATNTMWYDFCEGSKLVPTNLGKVAADAVAAMKEAVKEIFGRSSYAKLVDDPVAIEHHAGDVMLPVINNPGAVYILDTKLT